MMVSATVGKKRWVLRSSGGCDQEWYRLKLVKYVGC